MKSRTITGLSGCNIDAILIENFSREAPWWRERAVSELPSGMPARRDALRVLLLYYTQTGATAETVESFAVPLEERQIVVDRVPIRPAVPYPFPWRSIGRFFDVMPECVLESPCGILEPDFDADADYDLVVLFYPVWFLSPCLPVQAFFRHPSARVLSGKKVVTVVVSRNMWTIASEKMKWLLSSVQARHCDNVSVTHQGPIWATFITIPRLLLFGKRDRLFGIFPPPGLGEAELGRLRRFGTSLADQLADGKLDQPGSFFAGMGATGIEQRYLLPELFGVRIFEFWAIILRGMGAVGGKWLRRLGIYCFVFTLVCLIVLGIPLLLLARILLSPIIRPRMRAYAARLQEPSDTCEAVTDSNRATYSAEPPSQLVSAPPAANPRLESERS